MVSLPASYRLLLLGSLCLHLLALYYLINLTAKVDYLVTRVRHLAADDILHDSVQEADDLVARDPVVASKHEEEIPKFDLHINVPRSTKKVFEEPQKDNNNLQAPNTTINIDGLTPKPHTNVDSYMPRLSGENIVSMSLWGSTLRYTVGAIRNAELVKEFFPGWKIRLYLEEPSEHSVHGNVPKNILQKLRTLNVEMYFMDPHETKVPPMMWRFLVADDMSVDRFIVRDTDSRLSGRDAAAVYEWVKSDAAFGCIRDHPSHAAYPLSGGMWGGKPASLREIFRRSWREMMYGFGKEYLQDMDFLNKVVWPKVSDQCYCVDSVSCDRWPGSHPFPIHRYSHEHVGQVYDAQEMARPQDIAIIAETGENEKCIPPKKKKN